MICEHNSSSAYFLMETLATYLGVINYIKKKMLKVNSFTFIVLQIFDFIQ